MNIQRQRGVFLLEALIAILIFSLGILGMVALSAASLAAQGDSRYRNEAAQLAAQMSAAINLGIDRTTPATIATSLANFVHHPDGSNCAFTGTASSEASVAAWILKLKADGTGLPGADDTNQQITVEDAGGYNRVAITVCWKAPKETGSHSYTLVSYIN
jgi:type IV pilus modification protein PilV